MRNHFLNIRITFLLLDSILFWGLFMVIAVMFGGKPVPLFQVGVTYSIIFPFLYAFGGYELSRLDSPQNWFLGILAGLFLGWVLGGAVLVFFSLNISRVVFSVTFLSFSLAVICVRSFGTVWVKKGIKSERVIVVGSKDIWHSLFREVSVYLGRKLSPVAYCDSTIEGLHEALSVHPSAKTVLIADIRFPRDSGVRARFNFLRRKGITVEYVSDFVESTLGRIPLTLAKEFNIYYDIALGQIRSNPDQRALNLVISILGLVLGSPLFLLVVFLVMIDAGFPIFFCQERVGHFGKPFVLWKFRTMKNGKTDGPAFADEDAYRITKIGKFLRKTRLDELPQLWNVLKGDMSVIGPRPEQPAFVEQFLDEIPFYDFRHRLRPGITGWAQINYSYASGLEETAKKLEYDLYYVKNRSLLLDLQIILKTIETMLGMRGAR